MQEVGLHLQKTAHSMSGPQRDLYARSAYNRYYYACFLELRAAFMIMDSKWAGAAHRDYPAILKGSISKRLKLERARANKMDDSALVRLIDRANRVIPELSELMIEAYGVRVAADYEPDISICYNGADRFSLNSVEVTKAHQWHDRVKLLLTDLLAAWKQINV